MLVLEAGDRGWWWAAADGCAQCVINFCSLCAHFVLNLLSVCGVWATVFVCALFVLILRSVCDRFVVAPGTTLGNAGWRQCFLKFEPHWLFFWILTTQDGYYPARFSLQPSLQLHLYGHF